MRVTLFQQALLAGSCILLVNCSTPQDGSSPGATAVDEQRASAAPPSIKSGMTIPAASSSFPTWRPPPPALPVPAQTVSSSARSGSATHGSASTVNSRLPSSTVPEGTLPDNYDPTTSISKNEADASFDNLEVVDANLKGKLAVLRVGSDPTDNSLLSVFVGLKNRTAHPLPLEIQTIYKDKTGNPMNHGSWIPMTLKPHEETEYRSSSISTDASDFLVRIRNASSTEGN